MKNKKILENFKKTILTYEQKLNSLSEEELRIKPNENEWSAGQVYSHVIMAHNFLFINSLKKCLSEKAEATKLGKNTSGKLVYFLGGLPPGKYKMPKSVGMEPPQPESKEHIFMMLKKMQESMEELLPDVDTSEKDKKAKHPAFGMLNAKEWYHAAEMHAKHHLKQIKRIEKAISKKV
ncbi:MAG: DinB family protein [Chitinophagaceae bacterium]|nr:MAG: DinB family protein [Chitinophagaceae bacterium]